MIAAAGYVLAAVLLVALFRALRLSQQNHQLATNAINLAETAVAGWREALEAGKESAHLAVRLHADCDQFQTALTTARAQLQHLIQRGRES